MTKMATFKSLLHNQKVDLYLECSIGDVRPTKFVHGGLKLTLTFLM